MANRVINTKARMRSTNYVHFIQTKRNSEMRRLTRFNDDQQSAHTNMHIEKIDYIPTSFAKQNDLQFKDCAFFVDRCCDNVY